jgi:uncharacterized protein YqeY
MNTLLTTITNDRDTARRNRDTQTLSTLTLVLSAVQGSEKANKDRPQSYEDTVATVRQQLKKLREERDAFKAAERDITALQASVDLLKTYLPVPLTAGEIDSIVLKVLNDHHATNVGQAMKLCKEIAKEKFDSKAFSARVQALLVSKNDT